MENWGCITFILGVVNLPYLLFSFGDRVFEVYNIYTVSHNVFVHDGHIFNGIDLNVVSMAYCHILWG